MCKKLIVGLGAVVLLATVFVGPSALWSHAKNVFSIVHENVQDAMPVKYELERAERMIQEIDPEIAQHEKVVATEQVEIKDLKLKIVTDSRNLDHLKARILKQDERLRGANQASFDIGGRQVGRAELTRALRKELRRYKTFERTLKSNRRLLSAREEALTAAVQQLDSAKEQRNQLRNLVEQLRAQVREMKARESIETRSSIDESRLTEARELLQRLKKRVDISRQLHENRATGIDVEENGDIGGDVSEEVDRLFGRTPKGSKRDT